MIFHQGGNAVDAAMAMLATTSTMWDALSWGGETQALIYDPARKKIIGINALGVAPSGATASYFKDKEYQYPPDTGPLAAVTPGTPGGFMTMLAEWGRLSLAEVLAPAIKMADGYPIEHYIAERIKNLLLISAGGLHRVLFFLPIRRIKTTRAPDPAKFSARLIWQLHYANW